MKLPKAATAIPEPRTITLANGESFTVSVQKPTYEQRFIDEGNEVRAYHGNDPDAWPIYRLGRIRMSIVDWNGIENDQNEPISFSIPRLFGLMEAAPEVVTQLTAISNEAFRPLVLMPKLPDPPANSGTDAATAATSQANSDSTSATAESSNSPTNSESQPTS